MLVLTCTRNPTSLQVAAVTWLPLEITSHQKSGHTPRTSLRMHAQPKAHAKLAKVCMCQDFIMCTCVVQWHLFAHSEYFLVNYGAFKQTNSTQVGEKLDLSPLSQMMQNVVNDPSLLFKTTEDSDLTESRSVSKNSGGVGGEG